MFFGKIRQRLKIILPDCAAARIVRRIHNHQLRLVRNLPRNLIHADIEIQRLVQPHRNRNAAREPHHRLVYRKARIGIQNLVAIIHQRQHYEKHYRLAARRNDHIIAPNRNAARLRHLLRYPLPHIRKPRRRPIVRLPPSQRLHARVHYILRRIKIRLPDLQMDNIHPLRLEPARLSQHLKRGLSSQSAHSVGKLHSNSPGLGCGLSRGGAFIL